jgi:hypothetical protein
MMAPLGTTHQATRQTTTGSTNILAPFHCWLTNNVFEAAARTIAAVAAMNKCLAQSNKSRTGGEATKKREIRQPTLIR